MRAVLFAFIYSASFLTAYSQKLENILENHFAATNQKMWEQFRTFSANGSWTGSQNSYTIDFLAKKPGKLKIISTDRKFVYAYNGDTGWKLPFEKDDIVLLEPDETEAMILLFHFGSPLKGKKNVSYKGEVTIDGEVCYWLHFKTERSITEYFIEKEAGLLLKLNHQYNYKNETRFISKKIKQYRSYSGINIPAIIEIKTEKLAWEVVFDEMLIGDAISDYIFELPAEENK